MRAVDPEDCSEHRQKQHENKGQITGSSSIGIIR